MYTLLLGLALALRASPTTTAHAAAMSDTLTCTVSAAPKAKRRCSVIIPANREVSRCSDANWKAKRCFADPGGAKAVWVTGAGGAQCKISTKNKRTDWKTKVTVSMSKKSMKTRGAACALRVAIR